MADNRSRIIAIRTEAGLNDAETLARMFEDGQISDDGTVSGRLRAILEATENMIIPALQTGMEFSDVGFRGDQTIGGSGFRDPWPTSRNQVGHFLTAVGLGFDSSSVTRRVLTRSIRDWLGADDSMSDEEAAMRLIIGHELAADPGFGLG